MIALVALMVPKCRRYSTLICMRFFSIARLSPRGWERSHQRCHWPCLAVESGAGGQAVAVIRQEVGGSRAAQLFPGRCPAAGIGRSRRRRPFPGHSPAGGSLPKGGW